MQPISHIILCSNFAIMGQFWLYHLNVGHEFFAWCELKKYTCIKILMCLANVKFGFCFNDNPQYIQYKIGPYFTISGM